MLIRHCWESNPKFGLKSVLADSPPVVSSPMLGKEDAQPHNQMNVRAPPWRRAWAHVPISSFSLEVRRCHQITWPLKCEQQSFETIATGMTTSIMFQRLNILLVAVCLTSFLLACSTHPLPDDVTRKSTFDIVKNLICEAREGVRAVEMTPAQRRQTIIGFDFTFDITEQNKAMATSFDFVHPFASGNKFSLVLNGGVDKKRQAERFVRVLNTFDELHHKSTCLDPVERAKFVYPISGRIGLEEIVSTYTRLRRETTLRENKTFEGAVFSDKLTYTTNLKIGVKPTIELKSIAGSFRLNKGTVDGTADRVDVHKVTIAISTTKAGQEASSGARGFIVRRAVSPGSTGDAAAVVDELDRLRNRDDDLKTLETLRLLPTQ
jgi:hypothetical protein